MKSEEEIITLINETKEKINKNDRDYIQDKIRYDEYIRQNYNYIGWYSALR